MHAAEAVSPPLSIISPGAACGAHLSKQQNLSLTCHFPSLRCSERSEHSEAILIIPVTLSSQKSATYLDTVPNLTITSVGERGDDTASAACTSILYRVCYDPPQ